MRIAVVFLAAGMVFAMAPPTFASTQQVPMPTPPDPLPAPAENGLYPMPFPIQTDPANYTYTDTFGHCRSGCSRGHFGVDIMSYGNKGLPVVAVADGTITWTSSSCCALAINHDDGWKSYYIHLNNDSQNPDGSYTDDGTLWYLPGIVEGARVKRGQVLGTTGDSGNAEACNCPHLHFELWAPVDLDNPNWRERQVLINPTPQVLAAESVPIDPEEGVRPCESGVCDSVGFVDIGSEWSLFDALSAEASVDDFFYGDPGDVPFMGDWDGDGTATPGLYRQSDGFVYLRNSNTQGVADTTFFFGNPGDYPLVGDFDGDGDDTVSIYRQSEGRVYVVNELGEDGGGLGAADYDFFFGNPGDTPFVGDFDGDGIDSVGLYRTSSGFVYFRDELSEGVADSSFFYGNPDDVILAGDWDGDGDDTVAVYRPSSGRLYVNLENSSGVADYTLYVGNYAGAVTFRRAGA